MEEKQATSGNKPENKKGKKSYKRRYQPQQQRKRRFWNADKIVSLSAMAIALFTLVVLIYQSRVLEKQYDLSVKQQKASVLPYLILADGFGDDSYQIILANKGLGPAFIKGLYAREKDSIFLLYNFKEYYDKNNDTDTDSSYSYSTHGLVPGFLLAPGETIQLFAAEGSNTTVRPVKEFFHKYFYGVGSNSFVIEYESVFEDAWVVESSLQNFTKEEYGEFEVHYDKKE